MAEVTQPSRGEREAHIKDKAGWVITILAALLAINTLIGGANSSKILNSTIAANDIWAFYQAKSIKQTLAEMAYDDAVRVNDVKKATAMQAKIARLESDPVTKEGKQELMAKAKQLEADRSVAKQRSPWYTYAGSLLQIAIVLLTASILAVNMSLLWASLVVGGIAILLMVQAITLIIPIII
jgi:hypothetical protein